MRPGAPASREPGRATPHHATGPRVTPSRAKPARSSALCSLILAASRQALPRRACSYDRALRMATPAATASATRTCSPIRADGDELAEAVAVQAAPARPQNRSPSAPSAHRSSRPCALPGRRSDTIHAECTAAVTVPVASGVSRAPSFAWRGRQRHAPRCRGGRAASLGSLVPGAPSPFSAAWYRGIRGAGAARTPPRFCTDHTSRAMPAPSRRTTTSEGRHAMMQDGSVG